MDRAGRQSVETAATGRPEHHPSAPLQLYVYVYLNLVHSSRRLEGDAQRNLDVMWLLQRLAPAFKTIAGFRIGQVLSSTSWARIEVKAEALHFRARIGVDKTGLYPTTFGISYSTSILSRIVGWMPQ